MQVTDKPYGYMIPVGEADRQRLDALGAIFNPASIELMTPYASSSGLDILDVGCGNGRLTCLFAKTFPKSRVVGVDISPEQIEISKQTTQEEGIRNVSWSVCDAYHLEDLKEIHPGLFDIVHSRFVLTHLSDLPKAVDQLLTMVRPGGILLLEEVGAKKQFKGDPIKAIQIWKALVNMQHQLQKSYPDTAERIIKCLSEPNKISFLTSKVFDLKIEGRLQKSMFRIGAEHITKKLQEMGRLDLITQFGYASCEEWLTDMRAFENDEQAVLEVEGNESIIAIKAENGVA